MSMSTFEITTLAGFLDNHYLDGVALENINFSIFWRVTDVIRETKFCRELLNPFRHRFQDIMKVQVDMSSVAKALRHL